MLTLEQKLRAGHVRRWHIVAVSREQTIAEHQYRVGLITEALLRALGVFDWNNNLTLNAMEWARVHDLPEVVMGDLPTNGKHLLAENGGRLALTCVERSVDHDIAELAESVRPDGACPLAGYIVKLADLLEAHNYLCTFGVGRHAHEVIASLWQGVEDAAHNVSKTATERAAINRVIEECR